MRTIGTLLCLMAAIVVVSMQISRFANEQNPVNLADEVDDSNTVLNDGLPTIEPQTTSPSVDSVTTAVTDGGARTGPQTDVSVRNDTGSSSGQYAQSTGPDDSSPSSDDTATAYPGVSAEQVAEESVSEVPAPCLNGDCTRRPMNALDLFSGGIGGSAGVQGETASVEEVLERGLDLAEESPVHLVFRGTGQPDTVRCQWRDVARLVDRTDRRCDSIRDQIQRRRGPV